MRRASAVLALASTAVLVTAPLAAASQSFGLGELLAPGFEAGLGFLTAVEASAPGELAPFLTAARDGVLALRGLADATRAGATDGALGSELGTPDAVGFEVPAQTLAERVAVPATPVSAGGGPVHVSTPPYELYLWAPGVRVPGIAFGTPAQSIPVEAPPLEVPTTTLATPEVTVDTPALAAPPLRLEGPGVGIEEQHLVLDLRQADLNIGHLRGTLYLGPYQVPYEAGPFQAGASSLPAEVARSFEASTPGAALLQPQVLVDAQAQPIVGARTYTVAAQEVQITSGGPLFPGYSGGEVSLPGLSLTTPGFQVLPEQQRWVRVPSHGATTPPLPGVSTRLPEIVLWDQPVGLPGAGMAEDAFGDLDGLGYFGYGRGDDSSMYPWLCTAAAGCLSLEPALGPWVEGADAALDAAAGQLDGPVVVRVG